MSENGEVDGMRVIRTKIRNVKRVKAIGIEPDPDSGAVVISGGNGQGKSSVLDAIYYALGGGRAVPDRPVREGETSAETEVEIGNGQRRYKIIRRWRTQGNGSLTIEPVGDTPPIEDTEQSWLNDKLGDLMFDPGAFLRMTPAEKREALLQTIDLPIDLERIETERHELYQKRWDAGRDVKKLEGALEEMDPPDEEDLPDEPVKVSELSHELNEVQKKIKKQEAVREEIRELEERLKELREQKVSDSNLESTREEAREIRDQIDQAEDINEKVRARQSYEEKRSELETARQRHQSLDEDLESLDQTKQDAIEAADLPLEGLGITEDGLTFEGEPLEQAADSEQLRAAVAIAMAQNPDIRVLRIKDGSRWDRENLRLIDDLCQQYGAQAWVEVVDESGDLGVVIEEGEAADYNDGHQPVEEGSEA